MRGAAGSPSPTARQVFSIARRTLRATQGCGGCCCCFDMLDLSSKQSRLKRPLQGMASCGLTLRATQWFGGWPPLPLLQRAGPELTRLKPPLFRAGQQLWPALCCQAALLGWRAGACAAAPWQPCYELLQALLAVQASQGQRAGMRAPWRARPRPSQTGRPPIWVRHMPAIQAQQWSGSPGCTRPCMLRPAALAASSVCGSPCQHKAGKRPCSTLLLACALKAQRWTGAAPRTIWVGSRGGGAFAEGPVQRFGGSARNPHSRSLPLTGCAVRRSLAGLRHHGCTTCLSGPALLW